MRVLIAEDFSPLRDSVQIAMQRQGWTALAYENGDEALAAIDTEGPFDVLVLDIALPQMTGIEILQDVRGRGLRCQVLFLSAKRAIRTRVQCLDLGADDYMTKPFAMDELIARVRALGRRLDVQPAQSVDFDGVTLDVENRRLCRAGKSVELTTREFAVFEHLVRRPERTVSKAELCRHAFGDAVDDSSNAVEVYIGYLRKKLRDLGAPSLIHTRRGLGYSISLEASGSES